MQSGILFHINTAKCFYKVKNLIVLMWFLFNVFIISILSWNSLINNSFSLCFWKVWFKPGIRPSTRLWNSQTSLFRGLGSCNIWKCSASRNQQPLSLLQIRKVGRTCNLWHGSPEQVQRMDQRLEELQCWAWASRSELIYVCPQWCTFHNRSSVWTKIHIFK